MVPNIYVELPVTFLAHVILRWHPDFWKIYGPLDFTF